MIEEGLGLGAKPTRFKDGGGNTTMSHPSRISLLVGRRMARPRSCSPSLSDCMQDYSVRTVGKSNIEYRQARAYHYILYDCGTHLVVKDGGVATHAFVQLGLVERPLEA